MKAQLPPSLNLIPDIIIPGFCTGILSAVSQYPEERRNSIMLELFQRISVESIDQRDLASFWNFLTTLLTKENYPLFKLTFSNFAQAFNQLDVPPVTRSAFDAYRTQISTVTQVLA